MINHLKAESFYQLVEGKLKKDSKCMKDSVHLGWFEDGGSHMSKNEGGL